MACRVGIFGKGIGCGELSGARFPIDRLGRAGAWRLAGRRALGHKTAMSEHEEGEDPAAPRQTPVWKILVGVALGIVLTGLLLAGGLAIHAAEVVLLIYTEGSRHEHAVEKELRVRGEKLALADFAPPAVPETENFFADPMWMELADVKPGRGGFQEPRKAKGDRMIDDLHAPITETERQALRERYPDVEISDHAERNSLAVLAWSRLPRDADAATRRRRAEYVLDLERPVEPLLAKLRVLGERPAARFPIRYEAGMFLAVPHVIYLLHEAGLLAGRAAAEIALGRPGGAAADILLMLRLAEALRTEPLLISQLVRLSILRSACSALADGLRFRVWSADELAEFDRRLAELRLMEDFAWAVRGERGYFMTSLEQMRKMPHPGPVVLASWKEDWSGLDAPAALESRLAEVAFRIVGPGDMADHNALVQQWLEKLDAQPLTGYPRNGALEEKLAAMRKNWLARLRHPTTVPSLETVVAVEKKFVETQSRVDMARAACALERYRLQQGRFPAVLGDLAPGFLPQVPLDIVDGQPLRYRVGEGGDFTLYSIGIDRKDGGGVSGAKADAADWVWEGLGKKPADEAH